MFICDEGKKTQDEVSHLMHFKKELKMKQIFNSVGYYLWGYNYILQNNHYHSYITYSYSHAFVA